MTAVGIGSGFGDVGTAAGGDVDDCGPVWEPVVDLDVAIVVVVAEAAASVKIHFSAISCRLCW